MELLPLGTGGYHPSERRHTACFIAPPSGLMLDAGTGLFRARPYLPEKQLDIFLTHAHLDHVSGLTYLLDILHGRDDLLVRVHADPVKMSAIRKHLFSRFIFPVLPRCEWVEIAPVTTLVDGGKLTYFPLTHPGGSLGFRIDWPGCSLAYITDTTASANSEYVLNIRGVNLLVHECNFPDGMEQQAALTGHSTASEVARVAKAAEVGKLAVVHFDPSAPQNDDIILGQIRAQFSRVELAQDLQAITF